VVTPAAPHEPHERARTESPARGAELARLSGMGLTFAATLGVFAYGGYWLDRWLGTLPLFLISGVLLGFLGATYSMARKVYPDRFAHKGPPQS